MNGFDERQVLAALLAAVTAFFVLAGTLRDPRWRFYFRRAALIGFAIAVALALFRIAIWLAGPGT